jgi:hypothetical protein
MKNKKLLARALIALIETLVEDDTLGEITIHDDRGGTGGWWVILIDTKTLTKTTYHVSSHRGRFAADKSQMP